jgi:1,4-alpha-glucan branching enzyme
MPASLDHTHPGTPLGANLIAGGAIFRVWAPHAHSVHVIGDFNNRERNDASLLTCDDQSHWLGFIPGVRDRQRYRHLLHARPAEESGVHFSMWRARFRTSPDSALLPFNLCRFKSFRPNSALVPLFLHIV